MDVNPLLTSEEILIVRNASSRFADWLISFVQKNSSNVHVLEDERILIIETMRTWWAEKNWRSFLSLMEVNTEFLLKDPALNSYLFDLLQAQEGGDSRSIARAYFEFAFDQYHDGKDSFYSQMGFDRMEETWKLFSESKNLDPTNVEIRSRFIGLMYQAGGNTRKKLLDEIQELNKIPPHDATAFGKRMPKQFYDHPRAILKNFSKTGRLLLNDNLITDLNESSRNAMINEKGSVYNNMLTFLINVPFFEFEVPNFLLWNDKTGQKHYLQSTKYYRKGDIGRAILAIRKSIQINPNFPAAHYFFGLLAVKLLVFPVAIEEFTKAINLQPEEAKYHYVLGEVYLAQENKEEALFEFKNALRLNPFFEMAQSRISEIQSE